jgi:uncharacterized membrane protein (UPF0127 family)
MVLLATACGQPAPSSMSDPPNLVGRATFTTSSGKVHTGFLDVASSETERRLGLMGRERLDEDGGMVFVFDGSTTTSFWMKDTLIPLSIAFWGDDGRIVDLFDMEPCHEDPCPTYAAGTSYTHALEMNDGWFQAHDVQIGDTVELTLGDE